MPCKLEGLLSKVNCGPCYSSSIREKENALCIILREENYKFKWLNFICRISSVTTYKMT